jgi:two-component system nitrogen regulation response regulator GlnG
VRSQHPFLAVNCAAIAPTLLEPTLFGHARGAFTGAGQARAGYFEEAGEGTLFLDEIGELPLDLQPKLLRVLENGEYQRVGETQTRLSRARIVAATNRDLRQEVRAGRFRADLYHRLSVFTVAVPPLRETGRDRLLLLDHFRQLYASQAHVEPFTLDRDAEVLWLAYGFPGNVRELRNIAIRLTARHAGRPVDKATLAGEFDTLEAVDRDSPPARGGTGDSARREAARTHLQGAERIDLDATLAAWEQSYIDAALELSGGNVSEAARRLGVSRTTLYSRMESRHRS